MESCTYLSLLYWATEDSNMARPIFYGSAHPIQNIWCLTGVQLSQRASIRLFTLGESSSPTQAAQKIDYWCVRIRSFHFPRKGKVNPPCLLFRDLCFALRGWFTGNGCLLSETGQGHPNRRLWSPIQVQLSHSIWSNRSRLRRNLLSLLPFLHRFGKFSFWFQSDSVS